MAELPHDESGDWSDATTVAPAVAGMTTDGARIVSDAGISSLAIKSSAIKSSMIAPMGLNELSPLDELYAVAKRLGRIQIEESYNGSSTEVKISFDRKAGSRVWAIGQNTDIKKALFQAIQEAKALDDR
jgi:hypothetical protein